MRRRIFGSVFKLVFFIAVIFIAGYMVFTWVAVRGGG